MIPHSRPTVGPEDMQAVTRVLQSGHLAQGEQVRQFEEALATYLGRRAGIATSSGTAALHLALLALGIGPGDEVLLPSYTCVALLHAVRYVGATPRLVEIGSDDYNLSARRARRQLTARTRAVIVPHMFGMPVDLEPLVELGVPIIEDCAQALGAMYGDQRAGSIGTVTICSFYATKVITTGEGGMLLSDSQFILRRARELRSYDGRPLHETRFNYKMTDMQAALGLSQLRQLVSFLARREDLACRYAADLRNLPVCLPVAKPGRTHIFYRYVIGVEDAPRLAQRLSMRGIQAKLPVFQPLHHCLRQDGFPQTETAMRTALSIPLYPSLTDAEVDTILRAVTEEIERMEERSRRAFSLPS